VPIRRLKRIFRSRSSRAAEPSPPGLDLFYWKPRSGSNFGDHLSSVIVTKMAADAGYFLDEELPAQRRLLAIGSILHFARTGDTIWGSGVNGKMPIEDHKFEQLDVRAVRGPLTRDFLQKRGIAVPEIYGDPALLVAELLGQRFVKPSKPDRSVAFVPNLHDHAIMKDWGDVISPMQPWQRVLFEILRSGHIISSSLHGLVIADAFGIPCTYLRLSETENLFKYEDYAFGAGRSRLAVTHSREEALRASPLDPPKPRLAELRAAFPYDLWTM
jgi:pyruvyltransferase